VFGRKRSAAAVADGLDARARRRLERFAAEFDTVDAEDLILFAGPAQPDAQLREAMDSALRELHAPSRREAAKVAVETFVTAAQRRYSEKFNVAELFLGAKRASTAEDRVRVFRALERAVAAVILWEDLDDDTRTALAGPWSELVDAAVAGG